MPAPATLSASGFLVSLAVTIVFASGLSHAFKDQWRVLGDAEGRLGAFDGLRGLLSYGVFAHHAGILYYFMRNGFWADPPSVLYVLLGDFPVATFFQLTAFLFWRKVLDATGPIDYRQLLVGRIRRLTPAYVVAVALTLYAIAWATDFKRHGELDTLAREVGHWFSFGFAFDWPVATNGLPLAGVVNSVLWTLSWEWRFYLLLPLFAVFRRDRVFPILLFGVCVVWPPIAGTHVVANFGMGLLLARLSQLVPAQTDRAGRFALDLLAVLAIVAGFTLLQSGYNWLGTFLIGALIYLVCCGATLFGLLHHRGLRLMGVTSYSFYLLHSPILFLTLWSGRPKYVADRIDIPYFEFLVMHVGLLVQVASMISFKLAEEPFLRHPVRPLSASSAAAEGAAADPLPSEQVGGRKRA